MEFSDPNKLTLQTYEQHIKQYAAHTEKTDDPALAPNWKWIDTTLSLLPGKQARILEIGSATGRDAYYIERQGYSVQRTDAAKGFVQLLRQDGYDCMTLNVLTDDIPRPQNLILANAVFPHFNRSQLKTVLHTCSDVLALQGLLAFSCKLGEGEKWTTEKLDEPRYICYWPAEELLSATRAAGFQIVWTLADIPGQYDHRWLFIVAKRSVKTPTN